MRHLIAIAGILISLPIMAFFGVGSSTFIRPGEKTFAQLMLLLGIGLFAVSIAAMFMPSLARFNLVALAAALLMCGSVWLYAR